MDTITTPTEQQRHEHLVEHVFHRLGDCSSTRELRYMLQAALELFEGATAKLRSIENLEVHGGEFVDAAALYTILGKAVPAPVDHAANIHENHDA